MKLIQLKDSQKTIINLKHVTSIRCKNVKGSNPYSEIIIGFVNNNILHIRYEEYEEMNKRRDIEYISDEFVCSRE